MSDPIAVFIDFENVAIWAAQEFLDFEITPLMEYLQSRGPVVVKRAYGDWSRFTRYRDELMNNSIDLTQLYSLRSGKNRADIHMAIDALETATTRPHIRTFVIISGDSDFGPLAAKLREYGRYTLGIGPRNITHRLLVTSCDEFVYLETLLDDGPENAQISNQSTSDRGVARELLQKALLSYGQRGEIPVLAAKLKHTMLSMDPTFNETNLGYPQFKAWLDDNQDIVKTIVNELQLYVTPVDFVTPSNTEAVSSSTSEGVSTMHPAAQTTLEIQYRQLFNRLKMNLTDLSTRRDVLRDIYRDLYQRPGERTTEQILDELQQRYESQGLARSKTILRSIWQMGFRQRAFEYEGQVVSVHTPVRLATGIDSEAMFVSRAESGFVYAILQAGIPLDRSELAGVLLNDTSQEEYIQKLLDDLSARGLITGEVDRYSLLGPTTTPFGDASALRLIYQDMEQVQIPVDQERGVEAARSLAKTAMLQRSQSFAMSAQSYLLACRLQQDAINAGETDALQADLQWYMASYASVKAGALSQIEHNYIAARPYYFAFFVLVQEDSSLWSRMRGLINPMLSYYWANVGRELGVSVVANPSIDAPHHIAMMAMTHPQEDVRRHWEEITRDLGQVNQGVLRRVINQLRLNQAETPNYAQVADRIEEMLSHAQS